MDKPALIENSTDIFACRRFKVRGDDLYIPSRELRMRAYTVVHGGAVLILPILNSGELVLIRQYRYPVERYLLEFPAGTLESQEEPAVCAQRELIEETGYRAAQWEQLGALYPAPGLSTEIQYAFIARELTPCAGECDSDELIEVVTYTPKQVLSAIASGEFCDGKSLALFLSALARNLIPESS